MLARGAIDAVTAGHKNAPVLHVLGTYLKVSGPALAPSIRQSQVLRSGVANRK